MVRMSSLCQIPMLTHVVDVDDGSVNTDEVMERLFHLKSRVAVWNWRKYRQPNICQLGALRLPLSISNSNMASKGTSRSNYASNLLRQLPLDTCYYRLHWFLLWSSHIARTKREYVYSDYKGTESYKTLVGITPQWNCSFCLPPLLWEFIWPRDSGKKWSSLPKHVWWW